MGGAWRRVQNKVVHFIILFDDTPLPPSATSLIVSISKRRGNLQASVANTSSLLHVLRPSRGRGGGGSYQKTAGLSWLAWQCSGWGEEGRFALAAPTLLEASMVQIRGQGELKSSCCSYSGTDILHIFHTRVEKLVILYIHTNVWNPRGISILGYILYTVQYVQKIHRKSSCSGPEIRHATVFVFHIKYFLRL